MFNRIHGLLLAIFAAGTVFSACNDNGSTRPEPIPIPIPEYPQTLTLGSSSVVEFKVYVGSPDGAVLLENHDLTPEYFWEERMRSYPPEELRFDDENILSYPNKGWGSSQYKFVNDSLFRLLVHRNEWEWSGNRSEKNLDYHIGYYLYLIHSGENSVAAGAGQDNRWIEPEKEFNDFPDSMTDRRDTVAICNIIYTYESDTDI